VTASSAAFDAARERELERIAKWGAVSFEEDPDPNLRALGFVNMVRRGERESAVFDLFPGTSPVELRLLSPALAPGGEQRDREAESIQYRPFENVGLEGRLVLSVPAAYAASLTDVVLEVRGRALFDSDLAATVSAGRQQSAEQMGLVQAIAGQAYGKALVTSQPDLASGATELRSVQWSLRAERDRSLEAILALAQAKVGSTNLGPPGTSITVGTPASSVTFTVGNAVPLQTGQAFTHFTNQPPGGITFQLAGAAPSQVTDLIGKITVTPDQLGVRTSGLPLNLDADPQAHPRLVGMAVAVVPWTAAPIQLKVQAITAPFTTLLGWSVGTVVSQAITMTRFAADEDIAAAIKNGAQLVLAPVDGPLGPFYDVIFSLSFRLPALEAGTVSATSS
jgi:hypothetical protein